MATLAMPSLAAFIEEVGGRAACLALSRDPNAKMTILLFPPGNRRPAYVAKVPTTDAAGRSVEREAARLAQLADCPLGLASGTVPRLIGRFEHGGRTVLVTTALPGRSMLAAYHAWHHTAHPNSVAADFAAAGDWLAGLQRATMRGTGSLGGTLDGIAEAIRVRFGGRPGTDADLDSLDAMRQRLAGVPVPRGVMHGDFWPGNLLVSEGRVSGVMDWETASVSGLCASDLGRFVTAYSLYLDRHTRRGHRICGHPGLRAGRWGVGVEYAMRGTGWYPGLARTFVRRGLERLGVSGSYWYDVLLADLAAVAAEADDTEFAWNHLLLFRRLKDRS